MWAGGGAELGLWLAEIEAFISLTLRALRQPKSYDVNISRI